jgi:hypothetical protein
MPNILRPVLLAALTAWPAAAQDKPPKGQNVALVTTSLAGQPVAVLPLTMVLADRRVPGTSGSNARVTLARWADSLLGDALAERAAEVSWILPPALRVAARRAAGMLPSPDQMGQSVMRAPNLKEVPDPLRGYLRQLLGLAGGARYALIPAALTLAPAGVSGDSLSVRLAAVLADGRLGRVVWRTVAVGQGENADEALRAALNTLFVPDRGGPEDGRTAPRQDGR